MKILVISQRIPYPPNKGEKIRIFNQIRYLRSHGALVELATCVQNDEKPLVEEFTRQTGCEVIACDTGIRWLRLLLGLLTLRPLSVAWFHTAALQRQIENRLSAQDIAVVYCTSSAMAEYARQLPNAGRSLRRIVDFMDLDSQKWADMRRRSGFPMSLVYHYEARVLGRYEKSIQQQFDGCIFISDAERQLFLRSMKYPAHNVHVVGNGIDTTVFHPATSSADRNSRITLLFVGVMDYFPNVDAMLWFSNNVWPFIIREIPQAQLTIAGMNPVPKIEQLSRDPSIRVTGFVDDIVPLFHDADIFVAPFQIARGVQNKILQAFSCELPVVTTSVGAEGIACFSGTHLSIADGADDFAAAVIALIGDPAGTRRLVRNAAELVHNHYSWEHQQQPLLELLDVRSSALAS